jgi:hypothetical protein
MERNTNIESLLFPVIQESVYLKDQAKPIAGLKAIKGVPDGESRVFSVVSDNYKLVTNKEALEWGKTIHRRLFPNANADSFEVFKIIAPNTRSYCHIDIIDKNYTLNIWKRELYVPFIRIHNSYNRSLALKFDIGFCRKLCNNGVIFEEKTVRLKFSHTRNELRPEGLDKINLSHLKKLEQEFIERTKKATEIKVPAIHYPALVASIFKKQFKIHHASELVRAQEQKRVDDFKNKVNELAARYQPEFGETAYTLFNVLTDFASNNKDNNIAAINGMQRNSGKWLNTLNGVNLNNAPFAKLLEGYAFLVN